MASVYCPFLVPLVDLRLVACLEKWLSYDNNSKLGFQTYLSPSPWDAFAASSDACGEVLDELDEALANLAVEIPLRIACNIRPCCGCASSPWHAASFRKARNVSGISHSIHRKS